MAFGMSQWRHRRLAALLPAYHSGELSGQKQKAVEQHLAECAACRASLQRLAQTGHLLSAARPDSPALPAERAEALFQRALAASQIRPKATVGRRIAALSLSAACLGLLLWLARPLMPAIRGVVKNSMPTGETSPLTAQSGAFPAVKQHLSHLPEKIPSQKTAGYAEASHRFSSVSGLGKRSPRRLAGSERIEPRRRMRRETSQIHESARLEVAAENAVSPIPTAQSPAAQGHLVVIMTGETTPSLHVTVTIGPQTQPGFTQVSAFRSDDQGNGAWKQCTIRDDLQAETVTTTQYQFMDGQPVACLALETRDNRPTEKGDRP